MRPDTLRRYGTEADFSGVEVLPIENEFWRFLQSFYLFASFALG
jgi:hypothetical protein